MAGENHEKRNEVIAGASMLIGGLIIGCLICRKVGGCNCPGIPQLTMVASIANAGVYGGEYTMAWDAYITNTYNAAEVFEIRLIVTEPNGSMTTTTYSEDPQGKALIVPAGAQLDVGGSYPTIGVPENFLLNSGYTLTFELLLGGTVQKGQTNTFTVLGPSDYTGPVFS